MLSLQRDPGFIAASALSSFTTNAATFVLLTVFALLAPHHRRAVVTAAGWRYGCCRCWRSARSASASAARRRSIW